VEVRHGGVDVLADPGTYCYHGHDDWRNYFRSTLGHNTVELAGRDQSQSAGAFMWIRHADGAGVTVATDPDGEVRRWSAAHDGYRGLRPPARHLRSVELHLDDRRLDITDRVETAGRHAIRMAFHLGPTVHAVLVGCRAHLHWSVAGADAGADLLLPDQLEWTSHRGNLRPTLGWYSARFGTKTEAITLLGVGACRSGPSDLRTSLRFRP